MRELSTVIDKLIEALPNDGLHFIVEQQLLSIHESIPFTAPEAMSMRWGQVQEVVQRAVTEPLSEEWMVRFIAVFTDLPVADVATGYGTPEIIQLFKAKETP